MCHWLALTTVFVAWLAWPVNEHSGEFVVEETTQPRMCVSEELGINEPCAFLIQKLWKEKGGDPFCTLHSCPQRI